MKVSKNFILQELVPVEVYERFGDSALWFLDANTIKVLQELRERYGSCLVNDKYRGGNLNYRGFRQLACTVGGTYSQHRYGRAFDCNFKNATAEEVRKDILANESYWRELGMSCFEDNVSWFHFDTRLSNKENILIVKP